MAKSTHEKAKIVIAIIVTAIVVFSLMEFVVPVFQKSPSGHGDYLQVVVTFSTGKTATYYSYETPAEIQADSILYNGQSVSKIETNLWITPTYSLDTGDSITSWSIAGTFGEWMTSSSGGANLQGPVSMAIQPLWTFTGQSPQPALVSGTSVEVASASYAAAQIQSLYSGWVQGQVYNIYNAFSGSVTINFAKAGARTEPIIGYGTSSTTVTGMFQVEYISSSTFSITGSFAYS